MQKVDGRANWGRSRAANLDEFHLNLAKCLDRVFEQFYIALAQFVFLSEFVDLMSIQRHFEQFVFIHLIWVCFVGLVVSLDGLQHFGQTVFDELNRVKVLIKRLIEGVVEALEF